MPEFLLLLLGTSFAHSWALALGPLLYFLYRVRVKESPAILYPSIEILAGVAPSLRLRLRPVLLGLFASLTVISLTLAAARPQHVRVLQTNRPARNLILALDISRSMGAEDFDSESGAMSRIEAVKMVVNEFISKRSDDRIGVVVFGSSALLLSPVTLDHVIVQELVGKLAVGVAGDGTAIGDGLGLSLKRIRESEGDSKAIILITDGVSNSGKVNPLKAARVARDLGIKVHTVGIGSDKPVTIRMPGDFFFNRSVQRVEYDEKTLREISDLTRGVFFNAQDLEGLKDVYREIDRLENTVSRDPLKRQVTELFAVFAVLALEFYLIYLVLARVLLLKVP